MRIYIAYKFSNVENKKGLQYGVQTVAELLEKRGHTTYVLGRDLQKWKDFTHPMHHKMRTIISEIRKADLVFAYVNSDVFSKGLLYELTFAKLFGKRVIMAVKEGVKRPTLSFLANKVVRYASEEDLDELGEI